MGVESFSANVSRWNNDLGINVQSGFERKHFNAGEILAIVRQRRFHISQQWTRLLVCHGALHASLFNATVERLAFADEMFVESRSCII